MLCGTGCVGWRDGCCEGHMKDCELSCHADLFACNSFTWDPQESIKFKLTWRSDSLRGDGSTGGAGTGMGSGDKTGWRGVADRDGAWNVVILCGRKDGCCEGHTKDFEFSATQIYSRATVFSCHEILQPK